MKNKIIFLISAILLFTATNTFAQVNEDAFDGFSEKVNQVKKYTEEERRKANEEYAKELAEPWTTHTLQEGYKSPYGDSDMPPAPYPQDVVSNICGDNKYCLEIATIWDYTGVPFEEASVKLGNIKDYKLVLYKMLLLVH